MKRCVVRLIVLLFAASGLCASAGALSSPANTLKALKNAPAPPPIKSAGPVEPPRDLAAARRTWGNSVQIAKLSRANPSPKPGFTFAVIGDAEPGRFPWQRPWAPPDGYRKQIRAIHATNADFIVQLGDFVSKGTIKNYRAYVDLLGTELSLPIMHVIGNHDRSKPNGKADKVLYRAVFGSETDYFFDYNGWRFVTLDSSDYRVTAAQMDWLDRVLDTGLKTVVSMHIVPAYLKGKIYSIGPNKNRENEKLIPKAYFDQGSVRFGEVVKRRAVARVYMGHIHAFGIAEHEGIRYVLTGGGGSPLYPLPPGYPKRKKAHYLLVEADGTGLRETVYELDGTVFPIP